eukprot:11901816-Karenia_brevis.AAC.1
MVRPCIDVDFNVSHLGDGVDREVKMFCATLAGNRAACQQIKRVHQQSEAERSELNAVCENLAPLFGACCRRGSAEGFVHPVLDKLD